MLALAVLVARIIRAWVTVITVDSTARVGVVATWVGVVATGRELVCAAWIVRVTARVWISTARILRIAAWIAAAAARVVRITAAVGIPAARILRIAAWIAAAAAGVNRQAESIDCE